MMPKFGCPTKPSEDVVGEIEKIGKLGFDFVEISIEGPKAFPEDLRKRKAGILRMLKKYKMFALGHTMWWCDLGSPYENVRKAWVQEGKNAIDIAHELGIKLVNFHFDVGPMLLIFKDRKIRNKILDNHVKSLRELVEYGKRHEMKVVLENGLLTGLLASGHPDIESYKYIVDRVEDLDVNLDIGHAFIHGGMKNVLNFISTFRKRIEHIHLHDNRGKTDDHFPLGLGDIDYEKIIKALKKIGYDKTITFEVFSRNRDMAAGSVKKFKDAWNSKK